MSAGSWTGGTTSGAGSTTFNSALALSGTGNTRLISGRTVNFAGTTTWSTPSVSSNLVGVIGVANGATLNNSGTWLDQNANVTAITSTGTASSFNNSGTYTKTGTTYTDIQTAFNNTGTVAVNNGILYLSGGGSLSSNVDVAAGATLNLNAGSFSLSGITPLTGAGLLNVSGGTATATGTNSFGGSLGVSAGTLSVGGTFAANGYSMSGGTLNGSGALTVNGAGSWTGGTTSGAGSTTFNSALALSGTGNTRLISGRTVNFAGTTTWSTPSVSSNLVGVIGVANGATLNNSGTWLDQNANVTAITSTGTASSFNNSGTYTKTGTTYTDIQTAFNNTGTVAVNNGILYLSGGGSLSSNVDVAAGATLNLNAGSFSLSGITPLTGAGLLNVSGGTATATGTNSFGGSLGVSAGTLSVGGTFAANGYSMSGGTLNGSGALTVNGAGSWTGGTTSGAGSTTFNSALALSGTGNTRLISGRTVNFAGTTTWSTPSVSSNLVGVIGVANGATLNNSGTWLDQNANVTAITSTGTASSFNNSGTYTKTGTTYTDIQTAFNNTGTVAVNNGILYLSGGGSLSSNVDVAAGATLNLNAGSFSLSGITPLTGAGLLNVSGGTATATGTNSFGGSLGVSAGTLSVGGTFAANGYSMSGGTLNGSGALTVNGAGSWTGGTTSGAGSTTFNSALALSGTGNTRLISGRTVNFAGTTTWSTPSVSSNLVGVIGVANGATLNNSGTWLDQNANVTAITSTGTASSFNNSGTYTKTGLASTDLSAINYVNKGVTDVQSGTLRLQASFINPGKLMGTGTIAATSITNNGHVAPGESPGTLTIAGNFVQSALGSFDVELTNVTSHDLLKVTGSAALGGILNLACYADCSFALGQSFTILDAAPNALTGTFSSIVLSGFAPGSFTVTYDRVHGDVLLNAVAAAVPEPAGWLLMFSGLAVVAFIGRRRTSSRA